MKRFFTIIFLASLALVTVACNDDSDSLNWGETRYFKSSFLQEYEPVIMSKTLNFSLNEDGGDLADAEFAFELYEKNENGGMERAKCVVLYKNGEPCPNNTLKVRGDEGNVVVGVEFTAEAIDGYHELYLKEVSLNGLDRIEYTTLGKGFVARKKTVMNPTEMWLMLISITLLICYLLWVIIFRPMFFSHLKFTKVDIFYPGLTDAVTERTKGCCKLILTNAPIKQSWLKKIFFVKDTVVVNELWTSKVTIKSGRGRELRVYTTLSVDTYPLDVPERREKFYVTNDDNVRIGIETW